MILNKLHNLLSIIIVGVISKSCPQTIEQPISDWWIFKMGCGTHFQSAAIMCLNKVSYLMSKYNRSQLLYIQVAPAEIILGISEI